MSLHIDDYGEKIKVTVEEDGAAVNVSAATATTFLIKDPEGTVTTQTATETTDGTDGKLEWIITTGFLASAGLWTVQAHVVFASSEFYTSEFSFNVAENLS